MTTETVFLTVLFSTLYASTLAPRWMFAVWVWLIYLTFPGIFIINLSARNNECMNSTSSSCSVAALAVRPKPNSIAEKNQKPAKNPAKKTTENPGDSMRKRVLSICQI